MTFRITVFDPDTGHTTAHRFARSPVRIGRDAACELRLPFGFVSGQHLVLRFDDERAELTDPGSTNGVLREGRRLPPLQPVPILDPMTVTIGRLELRIARHTDDDAGLLTTDETATGDNAGFARVHAAIRELRPLYDQLLRARATFGAARQAALDGLAPDTRDLAAAMLAREFPELT